MEAAFWVLVSVLVIGGLALNTFRMLEASNESLRRVLAARAQADDGGRSPPSESAAESD